MFQPDYTPIPPEMVGELSPLLVSAVPKIINARFDRSSIGANFLIIPFAVPNESFAILVEVSNERLDALKNRSMKLIFPFEHPEKKLFFLAELNESNQIVTLAFLKPEQRKFEWPIPDTIDFDFSFIEKSQKFSLQEYARKRNRCAIEMIFEADELQDNMRVWSIEHVLLPFVDMVKSAILVNNLRLNANNLESKLKLGFKKVEHKCLRFILEMSLNLNLLEDNQIIQQIEDMHLMLDAEIKDDMVAHADAFGSKKLATDMIKVFRAVIVNNGTLKSKLATPHEEFREIMLNRSNARKRKEWLERKVSNEPYAIEVQGSLAMIKAGKKKNPQFAIDALEEEKSYFGKICPEIAANLNEHAFKFNSTIYKCGIEVTYTPETALAKEKYQYKLLSIEEAELDHQES